MFYTYVIYIYVIYDYDLYIYIMKCHHHISLWYHICLIIWRCILVAWRFIFGRRNNKEVPKNIKEYMCNSFYAFILKDFSEEHGVFNQNTKSLWSTWTDYSLFCLFLENMFSVICVIQLYEFFFVCYVFTESPSTFWMPK